MADVCEEERADGVGEFNGLVEALGWGLTAQSFQIEFLEGFTSVAEHRFSFADLQLLDEAGEMDDVIGGDLLHGVASFFPGGKASDYDFGFKASFVEELRYTLTGGLVLATAVEVDVAVAREIGESFDKTIGFNANRTEDAFGFGIIVAVAADVGDEDVVVEAGS